MENPENQKPENASETIVQVKEKIAKALNDSLKIDSKSIGEQVDKQFEEFNPTSPEVIEHKKD